MADDDPMPSEVLTSYLEAGNLWVAVSQNREDRAREEREGVEEAVLGEDKGEVVGFLAAFAIRVTGSGGDVERRQKDTSLDRSLGRGMRKVLMHIAELSVHASHHRRGLGRRLLRYFEEAVSGRSVEPTRISSAMAAMAATVDARGRASSQEGQDVMGLSLTTYKHVAFNGPFYARFGFEEVPPNEIGKVVGRRGKELWDEEQGKIACPEKRMWGVKWIDPDKDKQS